MSGEEIVELLREIRDLLKPIAHHHLPEYQEALRQEQAAVQAKLAKLVKGPKTREACLLMNGSRTQADIIRECGINQGQLSSLISNLRKDQLLKANGANRPFLVLTRAEIEEAFK